MKRAESSSNSTTTHLSSSAVYQRFKALFGVDPRIYRAPGRVNLIGEHTDYNQGFVMPAAIDRFCWVAIAQRPDRLLRVCSSAFTEMVSVDFANQTITPRHDWSDYVVGTAVSLAKMGYEIPGADLLICSEVPIGSGLSSSASLEVSTAYALLDISGAKIDLAQLVISGHRAENDFVGARVGMMDQFISTNGQNGHLLMLDCRSMQATPLPLPPDLCLVVCNTGVKHQLASSEYNLRHSQCEDGVERLANTISGLKSLRDVTLTQLELHKELLPELTYRRCRHVVSENERVARAAEALLTGNFPRLGMLMAESHRSLRDDYCVSCFELDLMVEIAVKQTGVVGSRMTGGGFGGCTVNLVHIDESKRFEQSVASAYAQQTQIDPEIYVFRASEGVHHVPLESLAC